MYPFLNNSSVCLAFKKILNLNAINLSFHNMIFNYLQMKKILVISLFLFSLFSCNTEKENKSLSNKDTYSGFVQLDSEKTGISFVNNIKESPDFNFLNYAYINIGGGVAAGDINNDGLLDLYFTANQKENKLYLNKGNLAFEEITKDAGLADLEGWTTGVSTIDINNDGWLDFYVCKSASLDNHELRRNKLFVNQKNNTFKEEAAKWNINDPGFSIQSYFFDLDKDGDLDMYLVNHRADFKNNTKISAAIQNNIILEYSDQLYRNDGDHFTNITKEAGLYNKAWGLSAAIGDFNKDNWPDIYVANDYLEPDKLYINNKNGTFSNAILDQFRHISFYSMGSDFADFDNDLLPDLTVMEMTPPDHARSKKNMASMSTSNFKNMVKVGYHHQYMANVLQLNNGNNTFSEIGQIANVAKTDWSWAPLFADFDNDGFKDLFVSNGIINDITNSDFKVRLREKNTLGEAMTIDEVLGMIPGTKISNYLFQNQGDYTFKNKAKDWGVDQKSFSNGATYADLDNDGDLDLIVNNMLAKAFIYENKANNNYLEIKLKGPKENVLAIGAKVYVYAGDLHQMQELYLSRGYQSAVQADLHFGLNKLKLVDSVRVVWPDDKVSLLKNVKTNQVLTASFKDSEISNYKEIPKETLLEKIDNVTIGIDFKHRENLFDEFSEQVLLPYTQSNKGPFLAKSDVNADGLEDVFIGGASGQTAALYLQNTEGKFIQRSSLAFEKDKLYEDLGMLFFDADNDQDQDLYVVSGDTSFPAESDMYQDRLYINNGNGDFSKATKALPIINSSGHSVIADDIDKDGDLDLFVGGNVIPNKYPYAPKSYFLINENGVFTDQIKEVAPELETLGMVSNALFTDYDADGDNDLLVVGEWSKIQFFNNHDGRFTKTTISGLENSTGMWFGLAENDIDSDGDMDYFIGNLSGNAKFKVNEKKEFHVFCDDFDANGTYDVVLSGKYNGNLVPARGKECSTQQMPFVSEKFPTYSEFAEAKLGDIFGEDNLANALHYQADILHNIFLENLGADGFKIVKLPNEAQFSPMHSFNFVDLNADAKNEIIALGNTFEAEVETQRYDASYGTVLRYIDGEFTSVKTTISGLSTTGNAKQNLILSGANDSRYLLVSNNDGEIDIFRIKNQ